MFLSETLVRGFHDKVISVVGGLPGEYEGRLDSALSAVKTAYCYGQISSPTSLAGFYGHALACGHCFIDGNKRTALLAIVTVLLVHGIDVEPPQEEIADTIEAVASGKKSRDDLIMFLEQAIATLAESPQM